MDISDSTMYPVLRRLKKEGYVETYEHPIDGRNRRYYTITKLGREKFQNYVQEWINYKNMMDKIMIGSIDHE